MSRSKLFLLDMPAQTLKYNILPTKRDALLAIQYEKIANGKTYSEAINNVLVEILNIWMKASLPVVSERQIRSDISKLHEEYRKMLIADKSRRSKEAFKKKAALFSVGC